MPAILFPFLSPACLAATVTFSEYVAADASDFTWVSPPNTVSLAAFNFGGDETGHGGIAWLDCTDSGGGVVCGNNVNPADFDIYFSIPGVAWGNNQPNTFYPDGPLLLADGAWRSESTAQIDIYGFRSNTHYKVQFVVADDRTAEWAVGRAVQIQGLDTIAGQNSAAVQYAYGDGRYAVVTADFVADIDQVTSGLKVIPLETVKGAGTQINAVQILKVLHTVTYDGNGNDDGAAPVDGNSPYDYGATVTVPGNPGGLTRSGYVFTGWNTSAEGNGSSYAEGGTFVITGDTTLYARWVPADQYVVTYNGNGSTGGDVPQDIATYAPGAAVVVLGAGSLERTGHTFTNWNTVADGGGASLAPGGTFNIASNTTLYARWTLNTYTIDYAASPNGVVSGATHQVVSYGTSATTVTAVPDAGCHFFGWSDGVTSASRADVNFTSDITVTALFYPDIDWGAPTTLTGDSDAATDGTLVYAYTESGEGATVNGVTFDAGNSTTSLGGGNITMSGFDGGVDTMNFGADGGFSADYATVIKGGAYANSGGPATVTLNNLTSGRRYKIQFWVGDYRTDGWAATDRAESLSAGNTSGLLRYMDSDGTYGIHGSFVTGTFTAGGSSQGFRVTANESAQMNAIQVRDITDAGLVLTITGIVNSNGVNAVRLDSSGGADVVLDATPDLVVPDWQPVATQTVSAGSATLFDPAPTNATGIYRVRTK